MFHFPEDLHFATIHLLAAGVAQLRKATGGHYLTVEIPPPPPILLRKGGGGHYVTIEITTPPPIVLSHMGLINPITHLQCVLRGSHSL